jgi:hypothetical protein
MSQPPFTMPTSFSCRPGKRELITKYLEGVNRFAPAREIAEALDLPYKCVVDGLNALYNQGRVARSGRKFGASWGPARLEDKRETAAGWDYLAVAWFSGHEIK